MMMDHSEYKKARQDGIDEAIVRIESFTNKAVLQMRLDRVISREYYDFTCKLIEAQIKLLMMKGAS